MEHSGLTSMMPATVALLKRQSATWIATAILPLPMLAIGSATESGDLTCLYLGLGAAWLASELYRDRDLPRTLPDWTSKTFAIVFAVATNLVLFLIFGWSTGVQTHFPFAFMATLSVLPAIGMVPFLMQQFGKQPVALVFAAFTLFAAKLLGCLAARVVYGDRFLEDGYIAADFRTAKLMISLFWIQTMLMSAFLFVSEFKRCSRSAAVSSLQSD